MQRPLISFESTPQENPGRPASDLDRAFRLLVGGTLLFVLACIAIAVLFGGGRHPNPHFEDGGLIDVFSGLFLTMASALAWSCVLLQGRARASHCSLWLLMAVGFLCLAFDELLQFHETFAGWLRATWLGWPSLLPNWKGVVVIAYSGAGIAVLLRFWSEFRQIPRSATLLGLGGVFYAVHTAIRTLVSGNVLMTLLEEAAKLAATSFLALAMLAALVAMLATDDDAAGRKKPGRLGLAG